MVPTIQAGSTVLYEPVDVSKIKVGDVIVFDEPGEAAVKVIHRVYAIGRGATGRYFQTKGDANGAPDPWHVPDNGSVGKVVASVSAANHAAIGRVRRYTRACRA